jgi:tetratricopeptide (TPR) repeat protein
MQVHRQKSQIMKTFTAFCLTVTVAILLPQFALGQANSEAARLAKEGAQANKNQDWDKAIDAFRKAAAIDHKNVPNLAAVLQKRAMAYVGQQNFPMALEDLNEALKIMPNDPEAHERRAYVEMQVRDYDKALADYSEAIKERPNEARYYSYRAHILADKGDLKNALADTEKVLKIDKKNANAQALKTWIETQLKNQSQLGPAPAKTP